MELGLERVSEVAARMRLRPQFCTITVAGTNGKGSTVALLEAILHGAGYKVGAYTSPHMLRYNERVRIATECASDEALCEAFAHIEHVRAEIPLTYFEFSTLAALHMFCVAGVEVALLEVGLGGRLDAVNVLDADVAILSSVGTDHTHWLGEGREQIGREKAGIFRADRPAICADLDPPASVAHSAAMVKAHLLQIGRDFHVERDGPSWRWRSPTQLRTGLPYPAMRGDYQLRNAAATLMALECLRERLAVTQADVRRGLLSAQLPGRFQTLPGLPVRVLDVAHNAEAAQALAATLHAQAVPGRTLAVFGVLRDKPIAQMVRALAPVIERWYLATLAVDRGTSAEELRAALASAGVEGPVTLHADPVSAYTSACEAATAQDRVVVFGSFHTVSDILRHNP